MANETIYPFGQGGQLPSGYPIADDLVTDSAQVALSARQGKVLNQLISGMSTTLGIDVNEDGFFFVDSNMNIGAYFDDSGFHAINTVEL